jgi:hypothetical protein
MTWKIAICKFDIYIYIHIKKGMLSWYDELSIHPFFIRSSKIQLGEHQDYYKEQIQKYQKSEVFTDWEQVLFRLAW